MEANINREIWTIKMNGFSEFNREQQRKKNVAATETAQQWQQQQQQKNPTTQSFNAKITKKIEC